jgi:hypothetical protein
MGAADEKLCRRVARLFGYDGGMKLRTRLKPVRMSNGVAAMKLPSSYLLKCMADADARLSSAHFAFQTYFDNDGRAICVYAVADEIFVFTQQEASAGPFGKFSTIGIGDVRKLWKYLSSEPTFPAEDSKPQPAEREPVNDHSLHNEPSRPNLLRRGAKFGALIGLIGAIVVIGVSMTLSLLEIPIFGYRLVTEGSVISNAIGASITVAVIAACGAVVGTVVGAFLSPLRVLRRRAPSDSL